MNFSEVFKEIKIGNPRSVIDYKLTEGNQEEL